MEARILNKNYAKVIRAVIPAAGLGTRFLPAIKATPKEMLPNEDKPTIQYIVEVRVFQYGGAGALYHYAGNL